MTVNSEIRDVTENELTAIAGGEWQVTFVGGFSMGMTDQGNFYFCHDEGEYVGCYQTYPKVKP
jgi:hypothetical protein